MLHWIQEHRVLLYALAAASIVLFVGTLIVVPALLVRIPADYFARAERPPSRWADRHSMLRYTVAVGRNVLGCVFVVAGIALLLLPGQGLLTLLLGFLLLDFPGKYRSEKWLLSRHAIGGAVNWLRRRAGREPLRVER